MRWKGKETQLAILLSLLYLAFYGIFIFICIAVVLRNPELYCARWYQNTEQGSLNAFVRFLWLEWSWRRALRKNSVSSAQHSSRGCNFSSKSMCD